MINNSYTLSEGEVLSLVDMAVDYGVKTLNQKNALAITLGKVWLDGYINGNKSLTEADRQSLIATIEKYYFYDYWRDYDPDEPEEMGGSGINPVKGRAPEAVDIRKAPDTHYNYVIVDWYDEENDTLYQYRRNYRCDVGCDYKASFVVKTNEKYVQINATMHFVSEEDYLNPPVAGKKGDVNTDDKVDISDIVAIINQIAGTASYENADVNADEKVDISDIVAVINIIASGE